MIKQEIWSEVYNSADIDNSTYTFIKKLKANIEKRVNKIKYLGVYIDSHLKWEEQVLYVMKKLRIISYKFKNLSNILQIKYLRILYYALVESHLTYGLIAWGSATMISLNNLQKIQKCILKTMYKKPRTYPSEHIYRETDILNLCQLYAMSVLVMQYKEKNEQSQIQHAYNTRYKTEAIIVPRAEKTKIQKKFYLPRS
ncbi:hypothetical protein NQ318_023644 [Aromia moschata]|uniref:Reverse transcriptase N-terminal domain-containing protein n=1 Tax=Aromia moschata TaxID=1265417 RepID=A0AAV8YQ03_9CUCU|nr:hypothetical protein NQ318_023644 [Aromia moschata]